MLLENLVKELASERALSPRQTEILALIAKGLGHEEIAGALFIAVNTVKNHAIDLYRHVGVQNRTELLGLMLNRLEQSAEDRIKNLESMIPGAIAR